MEKRDYVDLADRFLEGEFHKRFVDAKNLAHEIRRAAADQLVRDTNAQHSHINAVYEDAVRKAAIEQIRAQLVSEPAETPARAPTV